MGLRGPRQNLKQQARQYKMFFTHGLSKIEIAAKEGVTRQAVQYNIVQYQKYLQKKEGEKED